MRALAKATERDMAALAAAIAGRRCSLFAGSGVTARTGGATWPDLIGYLKAKFSYDSPLKDPFRVMADLCQKNGERKVYTAVRERLQDVTFPPSVDLLLAAPWHSAFTTNYDTALEAGLERRQPLLVRTILTGREFSLAGLETEILCVKLMGSREVNHGDRGAMVLDPGDLLLAREERSRVFDVLATHAANLHFLFLGYSFDDGVFFEILERLRKSIGTPKHTYYALFRSEPDEEKKYVLDQYNIQYFVDEMDAFADKLGKEINKRDPKDLTKKRLDVGGDLIALDIRKIASTLSYCEPIFLEDLERTVDAEAFLRGTARSLRPFRQKWHFPRLEAEKIVSEVSKHTKDFASKVIVLTGGLGSGKTFVALEGLTRILTETRALGFRVSTSQLRPIPSSEELSPFLEEVEKALDSNGLEPLSGLVFVADNKLSPSDVLQFERLAANTKYPCTLIFETAESFDGDEYEGLEISVLEVDHDLSADEKERLAKYLVETTTKHRLAEIRQEEAKALVEGERRLIVIMYRALDPARRSIENIISSSYKDLELVDKDAVLLAAIGTSVGVDTPIAIIQKALTERLSKVVSYPEVFDVVGKTTIFLTTTERRTNPLVKVQHRLIAEYLCRQAGSSRIDELLLSIGRSANVRSRIELDFFRDLFVKQGVNFPGGTWRPFSPQGLDNAFTELKSRHPARPILHQLARLYAKRNLLDTRIVPLLYEALAGNRDYEDVDEPREHVLTTLAGILWDQKEQRLLGRPREDPEIEEIIGLLVQARASESPHPFDRHARILKQLATAREGHERISLLSEALDVIDEGLASVDETKETVLLSGLRVQILAEIDFKQAEEQAKNMVSKLSDGTGYAVLAQIEYFKNSRPTAASTLLDKALKAGNYPPMALALKIQILVQESRSPDYKGILAYVDELKAHPSYRPNWKSEYYAAVVYCINGELAKAQEAFGQSSRLMPPNVYKPVQTFWMENGDRRQFSGKIEKITPREGLIFAHDVSVWPDKIVFRPYAQDALPMLKSGVSVTFALGFAPRGPIAWELKPKFRTA